MVDATSAVDSKGRAWVDRGAAIFSTGRVSDEGFGEGPKGLGASAEATVAALSVEELAEAMRPVTAVGGRVFALRDPPIELARAVKAGSMPAGRDASAGCNGSIPASAIATTRQAIDGSPGHNFFRRYDSEFANFVTTFSPNL